VRWVSFHSGYDFGYLLKLLTCAALPASEADFFELLRLYFPHIYDIKYMVNGIDGLHGGLQKIAEDLQCVRIGPMHQVKG
jgi:CCR4-NOT transcription complex subunit 7/8